MNFATRKPLLKVEHNQQKLHRAGDAILVYLLRACFRQFIAENREADFSMFEVWTS